MIATIAPTFQTLAADLLGTIVRALESWEAQGRIGEMAGELWAVSHDAAALTFRARQDLEAVLSDGIEATAFVKTYGAAAVAIADLLPALKRQRLNLPANYMSEVNGLVTEVETLHKMFKDVFTDIERARTAPPVDPDIIARSKEAFARHECETVESILARLSAGEEI